MKINNILLGIFVILYLAAVFYFDISLLRLSLGSDTSGYLTVGIIHFIAITIITLWFAITIAIAAHRHGSTVFSVLAILIGIAVASLTFINTPNSLIAFIDWFPKKILCFSPRLFSSILDSSFENFSDRCL